MTLKRIERNRIDLFCCKQLHISVVIFKNTFLEEPSSIGVVLRRGLNADATRKSVRECANGKLLGLAHL